MSFPFHATQVYSEKKNVWTALGPMGMFDSSLDDAYVTYIY